MSPRSARLNRELRDATRARLLDAGLRLFSAHGYASTSVDTIVRAAGVSPGLLYHYFPGKAALLRAIFEQSMTDVRETFAAADAEDGPRRIGALLRSAASIVRERRQFWTLSYGVRMQGHVRESLGPAIAEWATTIRQTLERYLRDAGWPDPALEAVVLFAQIDGLCQHYVLDPDHYPLDAVVERLAATYASPVASPAPAERRRPRNSRKRGPRDSHPERRPPS